ncbi:MAG: hypothetical protein NZ518_01550, partial [Dehalococcoidia bacterium]|nr:hypothetical protein [Dehalococcoidia bacterium]
MTPVLIGRWQTRLFTMFWIGLPITFIVAVFSLSFAPFIIWTVVLLLGFFWDIVYQLLQKLRWDRDWPGSFQFLA